MSTVDNTLQNYIAKYIEQTLTTYISGNKYDKLYRELLSKIEEIIKLTINEVKHYDSSLQGVSNDLESHRKLIHAIAKQHVLNFLDTHPTKKEIIAGFDDEHHMNESELRALEEAKDVVNQINNINLLQQNEENEELNIRKNLAQSIKVPSLKKYKGKYDDE